MNNIILITLIDQNTGEIFNERIDIYGWPDITEPYCSSTGRPGLVLRLEKVLVPSEQT